MKIEETLFNKYKKYIVAYNAHNRDEMLFKPNDALIILDELERSHALILGVDLWMNKNGKYVEVNSTAWDDITEGEYASAATIKAARELLTNNVQENEQYVSFVLEDKEC